MQNLFNDGVERELGNMEKPFMLCLKMDQLNACVLPFQTVRTKKGVLACKNTWNMPVLLKEKGECK